jgi:hypothetical protein
MDDSAAVQPGSAAYGACCARMLDAALFGDAASRADIGAASLPEWAVGVLRSAKGAAQGVDRDSTPGEWRDALGQVGIPFARPGALRFGADLRSSAVSVPSMNGAVMELPSPAELTGLTSLQLKPLRLFIADKFGIRLQASSGLRLYLWPNQSLVISLLDIPIGGFLYGSTPGQRAALSLDPGGHQLVAW